MAKNQTTPIRPVVLQADKDALAALKSITGYTPNNNAYAVETLDTLLNAAVSAQNTEAAAAGTLAGARDDKVAAEWAFHNAMLGVKDQVSGQFGKDSNELQALGMKKKSEHKNPVRKAKQAA